MTAPKAAKKGRLRRQHDQGGVVLVFFTLSILVIMGIAAFVVDIGYWYLKAAQIQKAADSASLAGVVYMPGDIGDATTVADNVAASNGFSKACGCVTVSPVPNQPHDLSVTITDPNVPTFFAKVFGLDKISETRNAVAQYDPSIPLGSPENSFGTGNLPLDTQGDTSNIWAAVNGYCTSKENGDEFLSAFDGTWNGHTWVCPTSTLVKPAVNNEEYATETLPNGSTEPVGYFYDIDTPSTLQAGEPLEVQAYDPAFESSCAASPDDPLVGSQTINTYYSLSYAPAPADPALDQSLGTYAAPSGDPTTCGQWTTMFSIPNPLPNAEYRLQVYTQYGEANSDGSNAYGLRVYQGSFDRCSTISAASTCPEVHGENALSVYANQSSATASFYLASIDPQYAGHTMEITLFDPGEGSNYMQLIDPSGQAFPFSYQTIDPSPCSPDCDAQIGFNALSSNGGDVTQLNVAPTITPPNGEASNSIFNDRHVQLTVQIPANYCSTGTCPNGGWWSIKYVAGSKVTDRTTWSVSILGSPVHLVQ